MQFLRPLFVKEDTSNGVDVEVHNYEVKVIGGEASIQEPDKLIYEIAWKSAEEVKNLDLSYPENRKLIIDLIEDKFLI